MVDIEAARNVTETEVSSEGTGALTFDTRADRNGKEEKGRRGNEETERGEGEKRVSCSEDFMVTFPENIQICKIIYWKIVLSDVIFQKNLSFAIIVRQVCSSTRIRVGMMLKVNVGICCKWFDIAGSVIYKSMISNLFSSGAWPWKQS